MPKTDQTPLSDKRESASILAQIFDLNNFLTKICFKYFWKNLRENNYEESQKTESQHGNVKAISFLTQHFKNKMSILIW